MPVDGHVERHFQQRGIVYYATQRCGQRPYLVGVFVVHTREIVAASRTRRLRSCQRRRAYRPPLHTRRATPGVVMHGAGWRSRERTSSKPVPSLVQ